MSEEHPVEAFKRKHGLSNRGLGPMLGVSERAVRGWLEKRPRRLIVLALKALEAELSAGEVE